MFSIIVPVYNAEKYLNDCLNSVLAQTYQDFELILIDDGSTDSSASICECFQRRDSRVKFWKQKNQGALLARRDGIEKAIGEYVVFLDSDDMMEPNLLQVAYEAFQKYECDCVYFNYSVVQNGKIIETFSEPDAGVLFREKNKFFLKVFLSPIYNNLTLKAVKREALENKILNFDDFKGCRRSLDLIQSIPIYHNITSCVFLPDVLYRYSRNDQGISANAAKGTLIVDNRVRLAVWRFLESENVFSKEEFAIYRKHMRNLYLTGVVNAVLRRDVLLRDKASYVKKCLKDEYYKDCLKTNCVSLIYELFEILSKKFTKGRKHSA